MSSACAILAFERRFWIITFPESPSIDPTEWEKIWSRALQPTHHPSQETQKNDSMHFIACVAGSPPPPIITCSLLHIRLRVILSTEPDYQRRWMPACAASTRLSRRWEISPLLIIAKRMNKLGSSAWVIKSYGACPSSKLSASLFWQQGESSGALVI